MHPNKRIAYVLKAYPRFSETFILSEILAHEAAGLELEIFSLRSGVETCFHEALARVRSPLTYIRRGTTRAPGFWEQLKLGARELPGFWSTLKTSQDQSAEDLEQATVLARQIRQRGIEHIHAHFGSLATAVTRLAAQMVGISYSFTAHAKDIFHQDVDFLQLEKRISEAATVITVSQFNLRFLRQRFPAYAHKVQLVYNGLDLDAFAFEPDQNRGPLILGVGRLVEKKGFADLIDACALLRDQAVDFQCEIVGTGRLENTLAAQISALQLTNKVKLVGPLPQRAVRERLYQARVLAAPCLVADDADRDGLPTVLLEAMACGTACISTDVTGIPEALVHRKTGLAVPQRDPDLLASACARLLQDSGLRTELTSNARSLIEEKFEIGRNTALLRRAFPLDPPPALRRTAGAG